MSKFYINETGSIRKLSVIDEYTGENMVNDLVNVYGIEATRHWGNDAFEHGCDYTISEEEFNWFTDHLNYVGYDVYQY